ncbi:hypothetical protein Tco_0422671 [Tanacetum coccineum]
MGLEAVSTFNSAAQETPADVSDLEPLSYAKPHPHFQRDIAQSSRVMTTEIPAGDVATTEVPGLFSAKSPESKRSMSVPSVKGHPELYINLVPPRYFSELRHLPNTEFLVQYNINLVRQVAMGSQLRLRFEQEVRLLKKSRAQTLLEAEVDIKKATEAKNAELANELESLRAKFSDLELNKNQLSQQVSTLQAQVTSEERIKATFDEFKKYEDDKVEKRCAEMDARLDALSIDYDAELYPHMLTAIAGHRWVIGHDLRLAVMKCVESIELRRAFANIVSAGIAKAIPKKMLHNGSVSFTPALPSSQYMYTRRSDGVPVSVSTVAPQGLAILLADAATQTDIFEDEASPRLLRSKSLPPMYNLDWP